MGRGHWKQRSAKSSGDSERHFRRRLVERYGIDISTDDYRGLNQLVQSGKARFVWKESLTRTHYLLKIGETDVRAVYDKKQGALVTALPSTAMVG